MDFSQGTASSLLKDGVKHLSAKDQVVVKNIDAVKKIAQVTRTSMGPYGLNKLIINHLGKMFVSHDSATIISELEVIHPAAKLVMLASQAQELEVGDGTNFVLTLCAELLTQAEQLLVMGLHSSDIIHGYQVALDKALSLMAGETEESGEAETPSLSPLVVRTVGNLRDPEECATALFSPIAAKQLPNAREMVSLVSEACLIACPRDDVSKFNVDNIRVVKTPGGHLSDGFVVKGFAYQREKALKTSVRHVTDAKIAVFSVNVDTIGTETGAQVLITNAESLLELAPSEENQMEEIIKKIKSVGINVMVSTGSFGDLAVHYMDLHGIMGVKVSSKFDIQRLCRAVGATQLTRIGPPTFEEMGECSSIDCVEIGSKQTVIFRQDRVEDTSVATIVLRGATMSILDELEKAVDDGVNTFKTLTKDPRMVAGAGAFEVEMARLLTSYGEELTGLDQYSVRRYAESFLIIPRTLAECAGHPTTDVVSNLRVAHGREEDPQPYAGVDMLSTNPINAVLGGILDTFQVKLWGIRLATNAAIDILSVDQLIMARPSGGPKPRARGDWDQD